MDTVSTEVKIRMKEMRPKRRVIELDDDGSNIFNKTKIKRGKNCVNLVGFFENQNKNISFST